MVVFKFCPICKVNKSRAEFHRHRLTTDGLNTYCKTCHLAKCSEYAKANRARIKKNFNAWYNKNRERLILKNKEYAQNNRKRVNANCGEWQRSNPDKIFAYKITKYSLYHGDIEKFDCLICDNPNSEAHHEDYSQPLDIMWLCKTCHHLRHRELRGNYEFS